jgi:hypothetical protein
LPELPPAAAAATAAAVAASMDASSEDSDDEVLPLALQYPETLATGMASTVNQFQAPTVAVAPPAAAAGMAIFSPPAAAAASTATAASATPGKAVVKQPNFTVGEEWVLCQSYLYHTLDSRVGVGQTAAAFKEKVYQTFKQVAQTHSVRVYDRSAQSLDTKFSRIKKSVTKFVSILRSIKAKKPSGKTEKDMENDALAEYKTRNGHNFKYLAVLPILEQSPKFKDDFAETINRDVDEGEVINPLSLPQGSTMERPAGRDLAKRAATDAASIASAFTSGQEKSQQLVKSIADSILIRTKQTARSCDYHRKLAALQIRHNFYVSTNRMAEAEEVIGWIDDMNNQSVEVTEAIPEPEPATAAAPSSVGPSSTIQVQQQEGKEDDQSEGVKSLGHVDSGEESEDSDDDVVIDRERGGML